MGIFNRMLALYERWYASTGHPFAEKGCSALAPASDEYRYLAQVTFCNIATKTIPSSGSTGYLAHC